MDAHCDVVEIIAPIVVESPERSEDLQRIAGPMHGIEFLPGFVDKKN